MNFSLYEELPLLGLLPAVLTVVCGLMMYFWSHRPRAVEPYFLMSLFLGVHILTRTMMYFEINHNHINWEINAVNAASSIGTNVFFIIFIIQLFRNRKKVPLSRYLYPIGLVCSILGYVLYNRLQLNVENGILIVKYWDPLFTTYFFLFTFLSPLIGISLIVINYFKATDRQLRNKYGQLVLGTIFCWTLIFLPVYSMANHSARNDYWVADIGYILFLILLARTILRDKAIDVRSRMSLIAAWLIISALTYFPSAWLLSYLIQIEEIRDSFIARLISLGIFIAGVAYFQLWIQKFVDRFFRPRHYYLNDLRKNLLIEIALCKTRQCFEEKLWSCLQVELHFSSLILYEIDELPVDIINLIQSNIFKNHRVIEKFDLENRFYIENMDELNVFFGSEKFILLPLFQGEHLLGIIQLGERVNHQPISQIEHVFLDELCLGLGMSFANVLSFQIIQKRNDRLMEMTQELESQYNEIKIASRAKDEFLALISHELRTPLNGVMGFAQLLSQRNLGIEEREMLSHILTSSQEMCSQINEVLDFTLITSNSLVLETRFFGLSELGQKWDEIFQSAETKKLDFSIEANLDSEIDIQGDMKRLRQLIEILLSNAVKFTNHGQVKLNLSCIADGGIGQIMIDVHDTGIGIPRSEMGSLFQKFSQIDSSLKRKHNGIGLGLAIAKGLVELMQGGIGVDSQIDVGSHFWARIRLPIQSKATSSTTLEQLDFSKLRILVAEDVLMNQKLIEKILQRNNIQIYQIVENGRMAVDAWIDQEFDAILMDIQMPKMDGLEATRLIRQGEERSDRRRVPIFAVTANIMPGDPEKYHSFGIDEIISKPLKQEQLIEALKVWTQS